MGRITKGITSGFIGKVGAIQGQTYNGTNIIKSAKGPLKDKTKVSNQPQNEKFSLIAQFMGIYWTRLETLLDYYGINKENPMNRLFYSDPRRDLVLVDNNFKNLILLNKAKTYVWAGECAYHPHQNQVRIRFNPGNNKQAEMIGGSFEGASCHTVGIVSQLQFRAIPATFYPVRYVLLPPTSLISIVTIGFYRGPSGSIDSDIWITAVTLPA